MRRAVALAIRGYRRWVSGKGPLRRVRCTFEATESCSAYGLRAVEELSTSLPHAMQLVRARIRACRCTSVYRFDGPSSSSTARGLGWERDHELAPSQLVDVLAARGERPDTIAQVLAARTLVARWRGDRAAHGEARTLQAQWTSASASSISTSLAYAHPIPIRAGEAAIRHHRRAVRRGIALAVLATICLVISGLAIVPLAIAVGAAHASHEAARRLETQRLAATFLRPVVTPI